MKRNKVKQVAIILFHSLILQNIWPEQNYTCISRFILCLWGWILEIALNWKDQGYRQDCSVEFVPGMPARTRIKYFALHFKRVKDKQWSFQSMHKNIFKQFGISVWWKTTSTNYRRHKRDISHHCRNHKSHIHNLYNIKWMKKKKVTKCKAYRFLLMLQFEFITSLISENFR